MKTHYQRKKNKFICKLFLGFFLITTSVSFAQVANYSFTQNQETYTPLTDAIIIETATGSSGDALLDDLIFTDIEIPFDFEFNNQIFSSLNIHTNGFISFGTAPAATTSSPIGSGGNASGIISPLGADLSGMFNFNDKTATIEVQETGTAPDRAFVIEWKHFKYYSNSVTSHFDFNYQVHLHENGSIQFVYDLGVVGTPSGINSKVGLRGSTSSDYITKTASGTVNSNWLSTTTGTYNSDGIATNYNTMPPSGLTFTWAPPLSCETPTSQPTNLVLTNTGIIINGSFTASNPEADRYLILRTLAGEIPNDPVDGTIYTTGQNTNLNAYVAYYGSNTTFENNYNHGIRGNNEYTYTIYAVNSTCSGGPLYFTETPLTESIINCPITVNSITNSAITTESFDLSWPNNENGDALPYNTIIEVATDSNFTNLVGGSPYMLDGAIETSLTIEELTPNTQYFYRGKNESSLCTSSYSNVGNVYTSCVAVSQFYENFDAGTGLQVPNCWAKILVSSTSSTPTINVSSTDAASQPNNVSFYGNGADTDAATTQIILVSPEVNNLSSGTHRLRFKARKTSTTTTPSPTSLQIVALDGNTAGANIEVIADFDELTTSYEEYNAYFDTYTGSGTHIGIRRIGGPSYSYLYVDDIIWEPIPSCTDLNTITLNGSTPDGATISWTNVNDEAPTNGYEYFVTSLNVMPNETEEFIPVPTHSVTLTEFANGTYYFWVRRVCSQDEKSPWKMISFATIPTASVPWTESFASTVAPQGWNTTGWTLGTSVRLPNAESNVIHKNLYSGASTGFFTSIAVGEIQEGNSLSFDYRLANWTASSGIYNPPAEGSGNFTISISTNFGVDYIPIETITNNEVAGWQNYNYDLSDYIGEFVQIKITANFVSGDYVLGFDNFEIKIEGEENPFCLPVFEYNSDSNQITLVHLETINNPSPSVSGTTPQYEDFTAISTNVTQGGSYEISIKGPSSTFPSDVMVYIDFNQNGIFDDLGEDFYIGRLQPANPANANTITGNITIPVNTVLGTTKMRVLKNTNVAALSNPDAENSISSACDPSLRAGQTEDYTLNIQENLSIDDFSKNILNIYPNPTTSMINIQTYSGIQNITVYNQLGQLVISQKETQIDLSDIAPGIYIVQIHFENGASATQKIIKR